MKVLLVWEKIPEATDFYLLEGEKADIAIAAHGSFINVEGGDPDAAEALSEALDGEEPLDIESPLVMSESPLTVVHSGFMM